MKRALAGEMALKCAPILYRAGEDYWLEALTSQCMDFHRHLLCPGTPCQGKASRSLIPGECCKYTNVARLRF